MNFNVQCGVKGRYGFEVRNEQGELTKSGEFDNLILDNGLNLMATDPEWPHYCTVGSGSSTPTTADLSLDSVVAAQRGAGANPSSGNAFPDRTFGGAPNYELIFRATYSFGLGAAAGNLSEIGIGPETDGTNLFSRTLIKDGSGNPTTITVLSNEYLTVYYYLTVYPPIADVTGTVDGYNYTLRVARLTESNSNVGWFFSYNTGQGWRKDTFNIVGDGNQQAYEGPIGSITNDPSGTYYTASSLSTDAYVADSFTRSGSFMFNTGRANFASGVKSIVFVIGIAVFQVEFDPAIPKTNTDELTIYVNCSWARA